MEILAKGGAVLESWRFAVVLSIAQASELVVERTKEVSGAVEPGFVMFTAINSISVFAGTPLERIRTRAVRFEFGEHVEPLPAAVEKTHWTPLGTRMGVGNAITRFVEAP